VLPTLTLEYASQGYTGAFTIQDGHVVDFKAEIDAITWPSTEVTHETTNIIYTNGETLEGQGA
jgi:phage protein D